MTSRRIEHRNNPVVLPDTELLPSQRTLFEIMKSDPGHHQSLPQYLSRQAINLLGEALAYDVALTIDETGIESGQTRDDIASTQRQLALLAHRLIQYDPSRDPYDGYDRRAVRITDSISAKVYVRDRYDEAGYSHGGKTRIFTPEGFVDDPVGDFRQKLVYITMKNTHLFAEDDYFNFSVAGSFALYTNNLVAQPPRWEFHGRETNASDMFPSPHANPYFFHARPHVIADEELAQAVVGSVARIVEA